jgi:hypothetical protein
MRRIITLLAAAFLGIAMLLPIGYVPAASGDESQRNYFTEGEWVPGGFVDDDGVLHYFVVDENTLGPNGWSLLALFAVGTRFWVISEGGDGTGGVPAYARIIIVDPNSP